MSKTHFKSEWVIVRLVDSNPRKPGTQGHAAWDLGKSGMTVAEYLAATAPAGKIPARDHLGWDREHGWVRFSHETAEEALAGAPKKGPAVPKAPVEEFNPDVENLMAGFAAERAAAEAAAASLAAEVDARLAEAAAPAPKPKPLTKAERKAERKAA